MREAIRKHGMWIVIGALAISVSVWFFTRPVSPAERYGTYQTIKAYYMNEADEQVTVRPYRDIPPVSEGGVELVRAVYVTNGSDAEKRLAYLEKYTPEAKALIEEKLAANEEPAEEGAILAGHLVRSPEKGSKWYPYSSAEGSRIVGGMWNGRPGRFVRP